MSEKSPTSDDLKPVWEAFARAAGHEGVPTFRTRQFHGGAARNRGPLDLGPDLVRRLTEAAREVGAEKRQDLDAALANLQPGETLVYAQNWPCEVHFHPAGRARLTERGTALCVDAAGLDALRTEQVEYDAVLGRKEAATT